MNTPINFRSKSEHRHMPAREEAAEWFMRWYSGDLSIAERFAYLHWLKLSPVHIAETLLLCRLYSVLYKAKPLPFGVGAAAESSSHVIDLPQTAERPAREGKSISVRIGSIAAIAAILSVGIGAFTIASALQEVNQANGGTVATVAPSGTADARGNTALQVGCQNADSHSGSAPECADLNILDWSILNWQGLCALTAVALLTSVILIRHRKLSLENIGPLFSTFMAAASLPVAVHLCSFVLPISRGSAAIVFPDQYALYVSAAGFILLISSGLTICQLFAAQVRRGRMSASQPEISASNVIASGSEPAQQDQERKVG